MKKNFTTIVILLALAFVGLSIQADAQACQWARSASGFIYHQDMTGVEWGGSTVITDNSNNVIVGGSFDGDHFTMDSINLPSYSNYAGANLFIAKYDGTSGNLLWAMGARGSSNNISNWRTQYVFSIASDNADNIFITGESVSGSVIDTFILGNDTLFNTSGYLIKLAPDGSLLFAKGFGVDSSYAFAMGVNIVTDGNQNVYLGGSFNCNHIVLGQDTLFNVNQSDSLFSCYWDAFIAKFDNSGNELWAKDIGGSMNEHIYNISADQAGNLYVSGQYSSQSLTIGTTTIVNPNYDSVYGYYESFIAKFDANGNPLWAQSINQTSQDEFSSSNQIYADPSGNIYLCGGYDSGSITIDTITITTNLNSYNPFFAKFNSSGNVQWVKKFNGTILSNSSNMYLAGYYYDSITFDAFHLYDSVSNFLVKLDNSGNVLSAKNYPATGWIDNNENTYTTGGYTSSTITFGNFSFTNPYFDYTGNSQTGVYYLAKYLPTECSAYFSLYPDTTQLHHYIAINYATGTPPMHYTWNWGDSSQNDTVAYPSHVYANAGIYTICLSITDSTGCTSTYCDSSYQVMRIANTMVYVNVQAPVVSGINNIPPQNNILKVFPNPATNTLNICQTTNIPNQLLIITDVMGNKTYQQNLTGINTSIDVSKLSEGVYFYEIIGAYEVSRGKFIKSN